MDMITWSHGSEEGNRYLVVLRDLASMAFKLIPLYQKSDIAEAFEEWVNEIRNDPLYQGSNYPLVCYVRTDNAGEWGITNSKWQEMCDTMNGGKVKMVYVSPDRHAEENGYAEVSVGIVEIVIKLSL